MPTDHFKDVQIDLDSARDHLGKGQQSTHLHNALLSIHAAFSKLVEFARNGPQSDPEPTSIPPVSSAPVARATPPAADPQAPPSVVPPG